MSQYPSPYQLPSQHLGGAYSYDPGYPLLAPARRASVLMYVLGGLGLLCGLCIGLTVLLVPMSEMLSQIGMEIPQAAELGLSAADVLKIVYIVLAVGSLGVSVVMIVLAVFVRRGSMVAIVTTLVFCCLILLFLVMNLISVLFQASTMSNRAQAVLALLVALGLVGLFGLLLAWLIQAVRAASSAHAARMQYQAQWMQYQQQVYRQQ